MKRLKYFKFFENTSLNDFFKDKIDWKFVSYVESLTTTYQDRGQSAYISVRFKHKISSGNWLSNELYDGIHDINISKLDTDGDQMRIGIYNKLINEEEGHVYYELGVELQPDNADSDDDGDATGYYVEGEYENKYSEANIIINEILNKIKNKMLYTVLIKP